MVKETMTSKERVWAAINGQKVDRTPVDILATAAAWSSVTGTTTGELLNKRRECQKAVKYTYDYVGGWDLDLASMSTPSAKASKIGQSLAMGVRMKLPGLELPNNYDSQCEEQELMKYEDFETIANIGWTKFMLKDYVHRVLPDYTGPEMIKELVKTAPDYLKYMLFIRKSKAMTLIPIQLFILHPFFRFSMGRSMLKFMEDLYKRPVEPIERALQRVTDEYIKTCLFLAKVTGQKMFFLAEERASGASFPLHIFERFWMPYTEQIVKTLDSKGIKVWLHMDTCWDKNIEYFKRVPRRSMVLAMDGTTDMVKAREVLGDHLCFAGDLPAPLLCLADPVDVEDYCKRLIKEVGPGGLILSTGCEMPGAVKKENWRAMVQTAKNYMPY